MIALILAILICVGLFGLMMYTMVDQMGWKNALLILGGSLLGTGALAWAVWTITAYFHGG